MRSYSFSLHQLKTFATIAHEGSFTKAAEVLSLSEPSVSEHIKSLEHVLGISLFDRAPARPARLTEGGSRLLTAVEEVLARLEDALGELESLKRGEEGSVALGCSPLFYQELFPMLLASFRLEFPGINVSTKIGIDDTLTELLGKGHIDLAVTSSPIGDPHTTTLRWAERDLVLVGPPGHALEGQTPHPFHTLSNEPLIMNPTRHNNSIREILEQKAAEAGVSLQFGWEASGAETQLNAVRSGMGITALPYYAVSARALGKEVSILSVEGFPIRSSWYLAWSTGEVSPAANTLKNHLMSKRAEIESIALYGAADSTGGTPLPLLL